jgi:Bacterial protein of unknown function (DUF839)
MTLFDAPSAQKSARSAGSGSQHRPAAAATARGLQHRSFSWAGDLMADGEPCPDRHDGMGVVVSRKVGQSTELVLVRNHERGLTDAPIAAPHLYNKGKLRIASADGTLRGRAGGDTTNLFGEPFLYDSDPDCDHGYVFEVRPDPNQTRGLFAPWAASATRPWRWTRPRASPT